MSPDHTLYNLCLDMPHVLQTNSAVPKGGGLPKLGIVMGTCRCNANVTADTVVALWPAGVHSMAMWMAIAASSG